MKLNLKLNMAAMNKEVEEEKVPTPVVKPLNLALGMPKLNLTNEAPAPKEEKVAEEKKQRLKVDLLIGNLLDFSVDAHYDENSRKKLVTEEVKKKFKLQKGDKLGFELFALRPLNGENEDEFTYVCKPTNDVQLSSLLELSQQNADLKVKLEKTSKALLLFEQQNNLLRKELQSRDQIIKEYEQQKEQSHEMVETLKQQHQELTNALTPEPVKSFKLNLNKLQ